MVDAMEMDNRSKDALSDYYYFTMKYTDGTEHLLRFYVERDDYPFHPWKDFDGFLTTINVWWNRYALGHNEGNGDGTEMLKELVEKHVSKDLIKEKALNGNFNVKYFVDTDDDEWDYRATYIGWDKAEHEYFIQYGDEGLIEDVLDSLANNEMMVLLQTHATESIAIMPVYIYEHSGIAISTGSYGDPWDSGCAGFAYIEKCKYEKIGLAWDTKDARETIESEVHMYDQYLQGDVYMYCEEEYDAGNDSFYTSENCGGFYSDNWGDKLAKELVNDMCKDPVLISEEEAEEFIKEAQIMEQANLGVAI